MINILAVLVIGVIYMILGFVWYGPLFGKMYGRIMGMDMASMTPETKKAMQKRMGPVYFLNFVMVLITVYVLALFVNFGVGGSGIGAALWVWFGFIMPTIAGQAMWSGKPRKMAWQMFWLSMSYQLIGIVIAGVILSAWR
jgi:hypothetical protein